jgi:V-type H+-transporting ATPase subunit a
VKEDSLNILPPTVERVIEDKTGMAFSYVAGLIPKEENFRFKRLVFRQTRGNALTIIHDMESSIENFDKTKVDKSLYVVIFRDSEVLRRTVTRVCEAFNSEM